MSDTLWAVVVGGLLTGGAAVGAQVLVTRIQTAAARDAWNRDQAAAQLAALESMYLDILRSAHQVENAVANWQTGALMSTQAHGNITAGSRDLEAAGLAIILRSSPTRSSGSLLACATRRRSTPRSTSSAAPRRRPTTRSRCRPRL